MGGFRFGPAEGPEPRLIDVDGDGDLDLVYLSGAEGVYLENVGLPGEHFRRRWGSENPFAAVRLLGSGIAFGDVDGDGDDDLFEGGYNGRSRYFRRDSPTTFTLQPDAGNPLFNDVAVIADGFSPALGDVDGDNDDDLVVREGYGFRYFEHVAPGDYVERTGTASPTYLLDMRSCADSSVPAYSYGHPVMTDLDVDGDVDLVSGSCVFLNSGGAFVTVYAGNPLAGIVGLQQNVELRTFGDLTGDGLPEMVVAVGAGSFRTFRNLGVFTATEPGVGGTPASDALSPPVPNPATGAVRLSLTVARGQAVRAALYDALGRHVAVLHDGPAAAGVALPLEVDVSGLPAGAYVVRVEGEAFTAARRVTVVR